MLLDENARLVRANRAATDLLRKEQGLYRTRDETLRVGGAGNQDLLLAALRRCRVPQTVLDTAGAAPSKQIVVARPEAAPLVLTVQPLPSARHYSSGVTAALLVKVPEADARNDLQWLSDFYGLTFAELQLVRGLANGDSLKHLAAWQGVSYETVRTHLRRVFDKTGTNRQVALVDLVRNAC
ncbi:hypothetical protein D3C85_1361340 [compost metagenome]